MRFPPPSVLVIALCACARPPEPPPPAWAPGTAYATARAPSARGLLDRRGLIHAHSVHSHDACDNKPRDGSGAYDAACNDDFRRGLCQTRHDFVFLTDHPDSIAEVEFPDTLLFDASRGDALVEHDGAPTANRLACEDGSAPLVMAGVEANRAMPAGLERHAAATLAERKAIYDGSDAASIGKVRAAGGVALLAHPEHWTVDELVATPTDGFEMYNLHANTIVNAGTALETILAIDEGRFDGLPHPDLFLGIYKMEDPEYLSRWGSVLARGAKRVTTMGTDCHRNSFPQLAQDGERIDSYRRMMMGFSNHLLVRPKADGSFDDRDLKDALRAGRLYGAFEFLGYPVGFDFHAAEGSTIREMGEQASIAAGAELIVARPSLQQPPAGDAPVIALRLLKAREGGFDEVARAAEGDLRFAPTSPGAYRAEVRITPRHLKEWAGKRAELLRTDRPWIYSNAIYVVP